MADEDYWAQIALEHPWWGVLSNERYRGAELDAEAKAAFMAEGERDMAFVIAMIRRHLDAEFAPRAALDFGSGVGRLTLAMSRYAEDVTGIDIAAGMRAIATAEASSRGNDRVRFAAEIPDTRFDWINSFIVFQHIRPAQGMVLLDNLLERLMPGGVVSLHFTFYRDARIWHRGVQPLRYGRFDGSTLQVFAAEPDSEMPIYEYDLSAVFCCLVAHGLERLTLHHTDHGGLHGAWLFGRKNEAQGLI